LEPDPAMIVPAAPMTRRPDSIIAKDFFIIVSVVGLKDLFSSVERYYALEGETVGDSKMFPENQLASSIA